MTKKSEPEQLNKPNYLLIALTLSFFLFFKISTMLLSENLTISFFISSLFALVIVFSWHLQIEAPSYNKLAIRGVAVVFIAYILLASWTLPLNSDLQLNQSLFVLINLSCILFLASCFKYDAMILPGLLLLLIHKHYTSQAINLPITITDYMPLVEFAALLGIAPLVSVAIPYIRIKLLPKTVLTNTSDQCWIFLIAVSIHCANYFFSAVQKIAISDPIWFWVAMNPTHNLMLAAIESGSLPISIFGDRVVNLVYSILSQNFILLNAITLITQLIPIFALRNIKFLIISMILFDITHVVIFLVTGIFFYKWIILNAIIVTVLFRMQNYSYNFKNYLSLMACMLLAPSIFFVSFLGWHDTPSFNDEYFLAHTQNDGSYRVPTNYFLGSSVTYAQGRISHFKPGHFKTDAMGVLYNYKHTSKEWQNTKNCILPPIVSPLEINPKEIENRIRVHHSYVLTKIDEKGVFSYDFYPHHIWSMPWEYREFQKLDKTTIIGYSYIIESKCLRPESNKVLSPDTLTTTNIYINVQDY